MKFAAFVFLLLFSTYTQGLGQNVISNECIRCLCNARTGCFFLTNCASYSISKNYWTQAGRPTVGSEDSKSENAYKNCMLNDECIRTTIRNYVMSFKEQDCDCDGQIDCKDYTALHLKGDKCRSTFNPVYLERLHTCLRDSNMPIAPGWNMNCQGNFNG